ncbi:hypothetical protein [Streptomyces sp. NPDC059092]|uniref:hypothetical protein n=1 Tax=Streptomyces sp. NPDC059092 TaxID=3346725 RepID=UPI00367C64DA
MSSTVVRTLRTLRTLRIPAPGSVPEPESADIAPAGASTGRLRSTPVQAAYTSR